MDVLAGASGGALIARPLGGGLGALHLTLFSSPHVSVEGVAAKRLVVDAQPPSYLLAIRARLR